MFGNRSIYKSLELPSVYPSTGGWLNRYGSNMGYHYAYKLMVNCIVRGGDNLKPYAASAFSLQICAHKHVTN